MGLFTVDKGIYDELLAVLKELEQRGGAGEGWTRGEELLGKAADSIGGKGGKKFYQLVRDRAEKGEYGTAIQVVLAARAQAGLKPWVPIALVVSLAVVVVAVVAALG